MKVVNFGSTYQIYQDDLKTYDELPAGTYIVRFNPMSGFSLERSTDYVNTEEKVYGEANGKTDKILKAYNKMDSSLGLILSGDKGIGKSLFIRLLGEEVIKLGMPVIIVNRAFQGIADFIESIDQEVLVLFDEFEKVFDKRKEGGESQDDLLGLFDGMSQTKRLYAITVNELGRVSEYMINRPGRFHYHLRFDYPDASGIREYLEDKVELKYHAEIANAVSFGNRVKLNYDCLRAVAFELNLGTTFKEAIKDLNILNTKQEPYKVVVQFKNHPTLNTTCHLDMFSPEDQSIDFYNVSRDSVEAVFNIVDVEFKPSGDMVVPGGKVKLNLYDDNDTYLNGQVETVSLTITSKKQNSLHYLV